MKVILSLPIISLAVTLSGCASTNVTQPSNAYKPINPSNLCSNTKPTVINEVPKEISDAAAAGKVDKLRSALARGLNPNGTDGEGFSLLAMAITNHQDAIIDLLLQNGADPNLPFMGSSPLSLALYSYGADTQKEGEARVETLKRAGARLTDFDVALEQIRKLSAGSPPKSFSSGFLDAIRKGDVTSLRLYVRATNDINQPLFPWTATQATGIPPLHFAAAEGTPEVVKYLVSCGANVNARTERGTPVLFFAKDRPDIQALLVQLGAQRDKGPASQ